MGSPADAIPFLQRAHVALSQKRYDVAAAEAGRALEHDPRNADAQDVLTFCFVERGDLRRAHASARRAIELAPLEATFHARHAWTILRDASYIPPELSLWRRLAPNNNLDPRVREIMRLLKEALRLDPRLPYTWYLLAFTWGTLGYTDKALGAIGKGLECDPRDISLLDFRAATLASLGRNDEAADVTHQTLALDPEHAPALQRHGELLLRRGRFGEAIDALVSAVRRDPNDADARAALFDAMRTQHPLFRWAYRLQAPFDWRGYLTPQTLRWLIAVAALSVSNDVGRRAFVPLVLAAIGVPLLMLWLRHVSRFVLTFHPDARHLLTIRRRIGSHFATYILPALLLAPLTERLHLEHVQLIVLVAAMPFAVATAQLDRDLRNRFLAYACAFTAALIATAAEGRLDPLRHDLLLFPLIAGSALPYAFFAHLDRRLKLA